MFKMFTFAMRPLVCALLNKVQAFGSETIPLVGPVLLVGRFRHNDGDDGETVDDPNHVDVGDGDGGCGDGVYGTSACSGLFCVCLLKKKKKILSEPNH